jgi:hypothetical protein
LTSEALVICPVDNQEWADAATKLYFDPLGFNGTTMTVTIPEYIPGDDLEKAVGIGVQDLVNAVETQYNAGAIDATDPLYIFGYSQSGVEAALAEQQLADYGIPSSDLHNGCSNLLPTLLKTLGWVMSWVPLPRMIYTQRMFILCREMVGRTGMMVPTSLVCSLII